MKNLKNLVSILLIAGLLIPILSASQSDKELKKLQIWLKGLENSQSYSIEELKDLKELNLRENQLTSLPESISQLKGLTYIDLRKNPISKKEIDKIKKLLPNCRITK